MQILVDKAHTLFSSRYPEYKDDVHTKQIIDDGLAYSHDAMIALLFFRCLCEIYVRYRLSFNGKKCDFFCPRFEWMGHDIRTSGNSPAQSKFDLLHDWTLPLFSDSLGSFIGLLGFCNQYIPLSNNESPLFAKLSRRYHRQAIPLLAWTPDSIATFESLKLSVVSDPCLARFSEHLPIFLKTDWSSRGMSYILMQPADDAAARDAIRILSDGGPNMFDTLMSGARLRPVRFGARRCTVRESHLHSFTGEAMAGRWSMAQCRRFLWGAAFYWLCDCNSVKEVLTYEGPLHAVCRLAQELFGYHFTVVHRPNRMMRDVDALNRMYGPLVSVYEEKIISDTHADSVTRPFSFQTQAFPKFAIKCPDQATPDSTPSAPIALLCVHPDSTYAPPALFTNYPVPISLVTPSQTSRAPSLSDNRSLALSASLCPPGWISVYSRSGSLGRAFSTLNHTCSAMPLLFIESCSVSQRACQLAAPSSTTTMLSQFSRLPNLIASSPDPLHPQATHDILTFLTANPHLSGVDLHCPFTLPPAQLPWLDTSLALIRTLRTRHHLRCFLISIPVPSLDVDVSTFVTSVTQLRCLSSWSTQCSIVTSSTFGDPVFACRWIAYGIIPHATSPSVPIFPCAVPVSTFASDCIDPTLNNFSHALATIQPPTSPSALSADLPQPLFRLSAMPDPLLPPTPSIPIFDLSFPMPECSPCLDTTAFAASFGVTFTDPSGACHLRPSSPTELLRLYSFPASLIAALEDANLLDRLGPLLPSSLPFGLSLAFAQQIFTNGAFPCSSDPDAPSADTVHCLIASTKAPPSTSEWSQAYANDPDTSVIMTRLRDPLKPVWQPKCLSSVDAAFHPYLRADAVSIVNDRLVLFQQLHSEDRKLMLIVVPTALRHTIFCAFHSAPMAGHLGTYKTLHRIRQRFHWPKVTSDVKAWCKACAHCILTRNQVRRSSELTFSWPISTPFFILHVDLWEPGRVTKTSTPTPSHDGPTHILAAMCDLTGFVLCSDIKNPNAASLAQLFMKDMLLKVGLCGMVVVDADSKFCAAFEDMCSALGLRFHAIARGNHQALSVERFFRVLNKSVTIAAADRNIAPRHVFVQAAGCTAYAWNSSPIDGTDILRCVAALGREFKFPLDIELMAAPTMVHGDTAHVHNYLRLAQSQSTFSTEILKILTQDRREYHAARVNANRNQKLFSLGDVVMVRVTVHSNASLDRVAKLSYRQRGPFEIVKITDHGAYHIRPFGKPDAATRVYHAQDLSLLPPVLRPAQPLDGPDLRYMNSNHTPIHNPLRDAFNIKLYNEVWLSRPLDSQPPALDDSHISTTSPDDPAHVTPSEDATGNAILRVPTDPSPANVTLSPCHPPDLFAAIQASTDRMFFVAYKPDGALRARWYLISIDMAQTSASVPSNPSESGRYYAHFFARHPSDSSFSDVDARWWPEWHEYTTGPDNVIDYGARTLLYPTTQPDASRVIAWADVVDLSQPAVCLVGPFNLQDPSDNTPGRSSSFRQYVPLPFWTVLSEVCASRGILPPLLDMPPSTARTSNRRSSRRRGPTSPVANPPAQRTRLL